MSETDIETLSDFRKKKTVYALIKMLAARTGNRLDYAKLSRLVGINRITVANYANFFEQTYLISRIPVLTKSADREIVKAQKIYFSDNGILNILADLDSGSKFENAVFCQLRGKGDLRYYSLKNGREIDFILDGKIALEAKESPLGQDMKKLKDLAKFAGISRSRLIGPFSVPHFADYLWGGTNPMIFRVSGT